MSPVSQQPVSDPGEGPDVDIDSPQLRFALCLDDLTLLLAEGTDHEDVERKVASAVRDGSVLRLSIEDPVTRRPVEALVNPSRAKVAWVTRRAVLRPPHIGTPGHA